MPAPSLGMQVRLWHWQRASALVLACCVPVHLVVIVYAVHHGLSGSAIVGRTRGSLFFGTFYTVFVLSCGVHVPIGLLRIAEEWLQWRGRSALSTCLAISAGLALMGLLAVYGVVS